MPLKRKPIKYIWREGSNSHCISNKDYETILNGCIDGTAVFSVKIDGCRIRLGKDENGNKLFYTSRQTVPCYESDVGHFQRHERAKNPDNLEAILRARGYDLLMRYLMSTWIYDDIQPSETFSFECVSRFVCTWCSDWEIQVVNTGYVVGMGECILIPHSKFPIFQANGLRTVSPSLSLDVSQFVTSNMSREAFETALQSSFEQCKWDGIVPAFGRQHEGIVVTVGDVVGKIALS